MADTPEWLSNKLYDEGTRTVNFFRALPENAWSIVLYDDGAAWGVKDILAHFVVTEIGISNILRNIIGGGSGAPKEFNLDDFNRKHVSGLENISIEELIERFTDLRVQTVRLVANMAPSDLGRIGRHPYLGESTLTEMIKLLYRHTQIHQRDIRKALSVDSSEIDVG